MIYLDSSALVKLALTEPESAALADWREAIGHELERFDRPALLVAHSFGCLAAVAAAADRPDRVLGALLVAPADPDCFGTGGRRRSGLEPSLASILPQEPLACRSLLAFSRNDPWLGVAKAAYLADRWGSALVDLGVAGHINTASGHGPWPQALALLQALRQPARDARGPRKRRASNLLLA